MVLGCEPSLQDLLAEPIIRMLMVQDRVSPEDVINTCESARARLEGCFVFHPERMIASLISQDGTL